MFLWKCFFENVFYKNVSSKMFSSKMFSSKIFSKIFSSKMFLSKMFPSKDFLQKCFLRKCFLQKCFFENVSSKMFYQGKFEILIYFSFYISCRAMFLNTGHMAPFGVMRYFRVHKANFEKWGWGAQKI